MADFYHSTMPSSSTAAPSTTAKFVTDIITPLKDRVALLPGSRDRHQHPIIFFPTTDISANSEDLRSLLSYFFNVTADDVKPNGFIFIIGNKKGASRQSVKPSTILHLINENFEGKVIAVYIIVKGTTIFKSSSKGKYDFPVQEIIEENLTKFIDSSQLLKEFGGTLHYDHDEWIELRRDIEYVIQKLLECYKECETCFKLLKNKKMTEENGNNWPINVQDEFDLRLNSISTIDCDHDIKKIQQQIIHSADNHTSGMNGYHKTPNPDLAAVIPNLQSLGKKISLAKADLAKQYQMSKLEQDQWNQFKLIENQANELKTWVLAQKDMIDKNFTVIGNTELEAQQLLKEHQRLDDAVEQTKVNYTHIIKHGSILISNFPSKKNNLEIILKDLKTCWEHFMVIMENRTTLLNDVITFRQQTEFYFSHYPEWMSFIQNQPENLDKPQGEIEDMARKLNEAENDMGNAYSQAINEATKLSQLIVRFLGQERSGKDETYKHVLAIIQKLAHSRKELHGKFEDKKVKLTIKHGFLSFMTESELVMKWIRDHGLPYMRKKTTIGQSHEQSKELAKHHTRFKNVAENTRKNAQQLEKVAEMLIANGSQESEAVQARLQELTSVVHNFFYLMEHREKILTNSTMFHLHFQEITNWYDQIKDRTTLYETVPPNPELCEALKDNLIKENEATSQAYVTVIEESANLLRMLKAQKDLLGIDTSADEAHIEEMTSLIETKHSKEIERWPYQRCCIQTSYHIRSYLSECAIVCGQIADWQKELQQLASSRNHEKIQYKFLQITDENMKQIEDVSHDFHNRYNELMQMIESNQLNLLDEHREQPITTLLIQKSQDLGNIIEKSLACGRSFKHEMSLNRDIADFYLRFDSFINHVNQQVDLLNKLMARIPEKKDDTKTVGQKLSEIFSQTENISIKYDEIKSIMKYYANNIANETQRRNIVHKYEALNRTWDHYLIKRSDCKKFVTFASKLFTLNEQLIPVIDHYLRTRETGNVDHCTNPAPKTQDLVAHLGQLLTKHASDKEKFLKGTIHLRTVYENFIQIIGKCPIQAEYRVLKQQEIRKQMEQNERRQKEVLKIINDKARSIEQCQKAVFIKKLAKSILQWLNQDPQVRKFYEDYKNIRTFNDEAILKEKLEEFMEFKKEAKKKHHEVRDINRHADLYHRDGINPVHSKEVEESQHSVIECFKTFWKKVEDMERQLQLLLGGAVERISTPSDESSVNDITERFSDSTLEEKLQQTENQKADIQMRFLTMLFETQLRKSIRRFAKHQSKHPSVIPHPNGLLTLPRGFRTAATLNMSLSNSHLSNMCVIREDEPSSSKEPQRSILKPKSEPNSPNFIRKIGDKHVKFKDQRYTWPLTLYDLRRPMKVLIEGEYNGIEYLRVIIDMYLPEYRRADKSNALPPMLKGKEKEIFGNIEDIYEFHQHFVKELELYKNNPTDVGCAFVNNIHRMRDIYSEYTINKEQNGTIHHKPETSAFFSQVLQKYSGVNNEKGKQQLSLDFESYAERKFNVNLDSVLMWPVQRLFKYSMLLKELIEFAPYEITEIIEVKEDIDGITSYANGFVKLADIEDFEITPDDIFCMAGEFIVTEPKRVFKKEKEYQVFLFETSILLTKKEKTEKNVKYVFREQIMLSDIYVVEHLDSNNIKFGLRKHNAGSVSSSDNTTIFKADSEKTKQQWVKKLREFTVNIQHNQDSSKKSSTSNLGGSDYYRSFRSPRPSSTAETASLPHSNRNSRSSRDSCEIPPPSISSEASKPNGDNNEPSNNNIAFRLSKYPEK